jgi:cytochrome c-type biogenesis protein CcmH/NrfG
MTSTRIPQHATIGMGEISLVLILLLSSMAAWSRETAPPAAGNSATAALNRDSERCRAQANLDACYDAIRWSPRDPALLVALGDALERANRPAEAIRAYRRALVLTPNLRGVAAKISAAEAKQSARRGPGNASAPDSGAHAASSKRASNAEPVAQSH